MKGPTTERTATVTANSMKGEPSCCCACPCCKGVMYAAKHSSELHVSMHEILRSPAFLGLHVPQDVTKLSCRESPVDECREGRRRAVEMHRMEREAALDRELERRRGLDYRELMLREREWERERERERERDRALERDWERPPRYAREPLGLQMDRDDHEKAEVDWYALALVILHEITYYPGISTDAAALLRRCLYGMSNVCLWLHCPSDASTVGVQARGAGKAAGGASPSEWPA